MDSIYVSNNIITCWIWENFEKRSWGMVQLNKSRFSLILASFVLFGKTLCPLWIPQRRATCAGDLLSFSAISNRIGSLRTSPLIHDPGEPNGAYAYSDKSKSRSKSIKKNRKLIKVSRMNELYNLASFSITERWMPVDLHKLWSTGCCQTGWHSTWLTAGGTLEWVNRSCNFLVEKLLTPMALACPDAYKPSMAVHVSAMHKGSMTSASNPNVPGFVRIGQCICTSSKKLFWKWSMNLKSLIYFVQHTRKRSI